MRLPFSFLKRSRSAPVQGLESVRSLFSKFQRIQKLNTRAIELMADMEQALGGEYIFDRAFLDSSVRELSVLTYHVVYSLNAMSRNRYVSLFDRYQEIKGFLDDILGGGMGPFASSLTLPYPVLGWEMEPLVGAMSVCHAEAQRHLDLLAPDGFVITATGCRLFMEYNGLWNGKSAGDSAEHHRPVADATFPVELEQAIQEEVKNLIARRGGPMPLSIRACIAGGYGKPQPDLEGVTGVSPDNILTGCKLALMEYLRRASIIDAENTIFALAVHETLPSAVVGSLSSAASAECPGGLFSIMAAPVNNPDRAEHYLVRRIYPFELVRSDINSKSADQPLPSGVAALSRGRTGLYRGSALLGPTFLKTIAESALTFERMLGYRHELRWARGATDRPVIVDVRPSGSEAGVTECQIGDALQRSEVLLRGGETVQTGVAAGLAVQVSEKYDIESFPYGAVAVVRVASPRLSPLLRRASAIISELGTSIGHLATIAREMRIPAIFGASGAVERIPDGAAVTVDAGERTVYRGVVEPLLASRGCSTELYPSDPEYAALRRLLRWIMPLELIDPESSDFCAEKCQSYHDIIHFAHERSVEELLHIQDRGRGLTGPYARKIEIGVPVDLFVIDLGGGVSENAGTALSLEDVASEPFRAFLKGLVSREMWSNGPGSIRLRDIISGLDRTFAAMNGPPEYAGMNHAIVAENYANIGLRLGYHFSVIDAYIGSGMNQNYIYFRFVGGFADEKRRRLRADFIRSVLEDMRFNVMAKGDLVVGKFKIASREEIVESLEILGQLTGFTRQLDISMATEKDVARFAELFREKSIFGAACREREEYSDA